MYSEGVIDPAEKNKLCLRVLTWLNAFMHGSDDMNFCQELVCDAATGSHSDSESDVAADRCVYGGQGADFVDLPVRGSIVQI